MRNALMLLLICQPALGQSGDAFTWLISNELQGNPGFKLLQREEHDVDHDGIRETLVSLEDTTGESSADSVWFYILQQKSKADWRVLLRNTGLVQCLHCGGASGGRGEFLVDTTGAVRFNAS